MNTLISAWSDIGDKMRDLFPPMAYDLEVQRWRDIGSGQFIVSPNNDQAFTDAATERGLLG